MYTAMNRSLVIAEVAVHFTFATLPDEDVMLTLGIPDQLASQTLHAVDLPANWNAFPHPPAIQQIGDAFVRGYRQALLIIPSVVTQGDFNVLINPNIPIFSACR